MIAKNRPAHNLLQEANSNYKNVEEAPCWMLMKCRLDIPQREKLEKYFPA